MLGLFVVLEGEKCLLAGDSVDAVEVEGLLKLKQRMDKRMEALMVHAAQRVTLYTAHPLVKQSSRAADNELYKLATPG